MTRLWRICLVALAVIAMAPAAHAAATAPPSTPPTTAAPGTGPVATNDLLPQQNDLGNCVGTVESANCGSRARADGHTYLVFLALAAGLTFIGWRIARGVRAGDAARSQAP